MLKLRSTTTSQPSYEFRAFVNPFDESQSRAIYDMMALLYQSYVEEEHWQPDSNAPAGFEISQHPDDPTRKIFSDKHPIRCHWFGVYKKDEDKLVACARAVLPMENGDLELHDYTDAKKIIETHITGNQKLMELNRCAVINELQGAGIALFLLHQVLDYYKDTHITFVTTTCNDSLVKAYRKLDFSAPENAQFRYEPTDPKPVQLFIISPEIQGKAKAELESYLKSLKKMSITGNTLKPEYNLARLYQLPQKKDEALVAKEREQQELQNTFGRW